MTVEQEERRLVQTVIQKLDDLRSLLDLMADPKRRQAIMALEEVISVADGVAFEQTAAGRQGETL
jgi:hypothetical protein